jgi:hypothetical protein
VDPNKRSSKNLVKWTTTLAKKLPKIVKNEEIDELTVEVKHYQIYNFQPEILNLVVVPFWQEVTNDSRFPLLRHLVRAVLSMAHGNADVERLFSLMRDTVTKKRNRLLPRSIKALLVIKNFMMSHNYECHNFPISMDLLKAVRTARSKYQQQLVEQKRRDEEESGQKREACLHNALIKQKEQSSCLKNLENKQEQVKLGFVFYGLYVTMCKSDID